MSGAEGLLKGSGGGQEDKDGGGKPADTGVADLLKGKAPIAGGDDPPASPPKDDDKEALQKKVEELEKVLGRQGKELGELRKQKPAVDPPKKAELPDPPHPSEFTDPAEYKKAHKQWTLDANKATLQEADTNAQLAEFEKQRLAAGITDEEWDETMEILNDPRHQNPATMRALAQYLKDPTKITREAAERLQELTSRKGLPGSTGSAATAAGAGGDFTMEEVNSFKAVMATPLGRRSVAQKAHMQRFGRFAKPTR